MLGAVLYVDRATPGRRVAGVEGERPLLLEARDQLGATGHSRVTSDLRGECGGIRRGNQMREKLSLLSFWGLIFTLIAVTLFVVVYIYMSSTGKGEDTDMVEYLRRSG